MAKYEKYPEESAESIQKSNDEVSRTETELNEAIERQEAIETEMDTADDSEQEGLSERHQALDSEIEDLRNDYESAEKYHIDNLTYWGF